MTINKSNLLYLSRVAARHGNCCRHNYGCVIIDKEGNLVGSGWTHSLDKCVKCHRRFSLKGKNYDACPSIHAEQSAIMSTLVSLNRDTRSMGALSGYTAILSCFDSKGKEVKDPAPCPTCRKLLKYVGITRVITMKGDIEL